MRWPVCVCRDAIGRCVCVCRQLCLFPGVVGAGSGGAAGATGGRPAIASWLPGCNFAPLRAGCCLLWEAGGCWGCKLAGAAGGRKLAGARCWRRAGDGGPQGARAAAGRLGRSIVSPRVATAGWACVRHALEGRTASWPLPWMADSPRSTLPWPPCRRGTSTSSRSCLCNGQRGQRRPRVSRGRGVVAITKKAPRALSWPIAPLTIVELRAGMKTSFTAARGCTGRREAAGRTPKAAGAAAAMVAAM